jgi:hypothetical protein
MLYGSSSNNCSQDSFRIRPGKLVHPDFTYLSDNKLNWLSVEVLFNWIEQEYEKMEIFKL